MLLRMILRLRSNSNRGCYFICVTVFVCMPGLLQARDPSGSPDTREQKSLLLRRKVLRIQRIRCAHVLIQVLDVLTCSFKC